ncbi:CPBP family intramembrane glutamic endopeptidase [Anaerocolumna sp. AGMB13020]|uniref:CPBP family intramembrane glutamic endopeptidase n=1 Tax=Anaerocolumna sp. AGMB13020 TaxID=3081750 RepID=UPI002954645D|nr:CPBP family intramembrane glutamic endopeptidase [Anaerocolumna sp. AGMB13020]WOO39158.1 CPBP family intramembrane glutamic endopeptidase [Anaerocolumna sp. AGMB13020]
MPLVYDNASLTTSQFYGKGTSALIPVLIYAFFQTSFNEELFFRGFLGKRLIKRFGFAFGNTMQGVIFGSVHGMMLYSSAGLLKAVIITLLTGAIGVCMGYVCEKQAEGSLVPSWLMHGTFNTLSSFSVLFL